MKSCCYLAAGLLLLSCLATRAEDSPKSAPAAKAASADSAASTEPSLRKPGFMFMELSTTRGEDYFSFFESVAGFRIMERRPGYIEARSDRAELTFIDPSFWSKGHPFSGKINGTGQGVGIEIGIVVADLDKAFAAAEKFKDKGFPISTGIVRRPWGVRDFRVLVTEGYYFRFTEGH
jgi:hypothetical protein